MLLTSSIIMCLFGCGHKSNNAEINYESELLFDYYRSSVAVVGEAQYSEITITIGNDDQYYINVYSGDANAGTTTSHDIYLPSKEVLDTAMKLVDKYNMKTWNDQDNPGLDGALYVVKFIDKGKLVRVSSENMPDNGKEAFNEISAYLSESIISDNKIK